VFRPWPAGSAPGDGSRLCEPAHASDVLGITEPSLSGTRADDIADQGELID
jgi:hypothetical protein